MDVFPWCFVVYLKTQGISPNEHPVKPELVRDLLCSLYVLVVVVVVVVANALLRSMVGENQELYQEGEAARRCWR